MIEIFLNGEPFHIDGARRLSELVERLGMKPSRIAVEVNRQIIPRIDYGATELKSGDRVEIVNFVGGG